VVLSMALMMVMLVIMMLVTVLVVRFELSHHVLEVIECLNEETENINIERISDLFTHHWRDGTIISEKLRTRVRMALSTVSMFTNVTNIEESENSRVPPSINLDISEFESSARVSLIATNNTRRQKATSRGDVSENNVVHIDQRLSLTCSERIEHASRTSTTGLLLLLGSNVDVPPNWEVDGNVLIQDVLDFS